MKLDFNITGVVFKIFQTLLDIFWRLSIPIIIFVVVMFLLIVFWYFYYRVIEKIKPKKSSLNRVKKEGFFKKIFYMFPKQLSFDFLTQDPDAFNEFGVHALCGRQGSGKTITAIYFIRQWQRKYCKLKVYTNIYYKYADGKIKDWRDLILHENGVYGIVNFYDEIHTAFPSKRSGSNIPPALLSEVSYQRKQKKALIMTMQVFGDVDKKIRSQVEFLYLPKTYLKCFTIVWKADPLTYDSALNKFRKKKIAFFFIHDNELREIYDTYEKVKTYAVNDVEFEPSIYAGTLPTLSEESSI